MTKQEMIERTRACLAEFAALPFEEQFRRLKEWGLVDDEGAPLDEGRTPGKRCGR